MANLRSPSEESAPRITEHVDQTAQQEWRRFIDSGMPELITHYTTVNALFAFVDSGMAARLSVRSCTFDEISSGLLREAADGLLRMLEIRGVVETAGEGRWSLTHRGRLLVSQLSFAQMGFYREAYGPVIENLSPLLRGDKKYPEDVTRNGAALGRHCTDGFHHFGTSALLRALDTLHAKTVLDLGCGAGGFLVDACARDPHLKGIGLDISADAIAFAIQEVSKTQVADRIELHVGDAFDPASWPNACREAEAIVTVGTIHEQFRDGEDKVVALLDRYADLMREGPTKGLVLGEPEIHYGPEDADFYLVHVFTKQGIPRVRDAWLRVFERSKLRCEELIQPVEAGPRFVYYVLRPRS